MKIYSIFTSIMGEANIKGQGSWANFIRMAGCNLRCTYCDTEYAQDQKCGKEYIMQDVLESLPNDPRHVLITGGEPMFQFGNFEMLVTTLLARDYVVSVETNGTIDIPQILYHESNLHWIVDYKLKSSGIPSEMFRWRNLNILDYGDIIKFVIADEEDYKEALEAMWALQRANYVVGFAFSPCTPGMSVNQLWNKMRQDNLYHVMLNVQLHKVVNLTEPR